jgi:UDP-glucose 4-epimerase
MNLRNKKFLMIGGAGLIGSHTVDYLLKEEVREIIIFDNFTRGKIENLKKALKDSRVKIFDLGGDVLHMDILNKAMQNVDGVFHFAALWLLHCIDYPRSAFKVNIEGTFNVAQACVENKVKKLIYSSSASVYGDALEIPMKEDHPYNNKNFYGATKIAGEHILRSYYYRHDLNFIGLRYMNVYGERQDYKGAYIAVIMKILDRLDNNLSPIIDGDGSQALDFINVEDCAIANIKAMKSNKRNEFYNVGTGKQTTLLELTNLILKIYKSNKKIVFKDINTSLVKNRIGCPVKAKKDLNFQASINLEIGLKKLIMWRNSIKKIKNK